MSTDTRGPKPRPVKPAAVPKPTPVRLPAISTAPPAVEIAGSRGGRARREPAAPKPAATREPKPKPRPAPRPVRASRPDPSPTPVNAAAANRAPRIDPRIRRRRIEVMRDEGRRRLRVLIASAAVIVVLLSVVGATRSPLLDVDHLVVTGATHTSQEQILTATGLDDKPQLIDVGTGRLAEQIERLPWIATAEATREWPATIRVAVTERTPAASAPAEGGRWAVVDGTGRVLEHAPDRPMTMPSVDGLAPAGPPGSTVDARGREAMKVAAFLPESVRNVTVQLAATPDGEIQLHIFPAGIVRMGDSSQLTQKLESVVTVLNTLAPKSWRVLDVRVPRAPVLTRR